MKINAIYSTYQGEVNVHGIGAPVIFIRTQGCHLRCYKTTLGMLCDTPEALEKDKGGTDMSVDAILNTVNKISESTGGIKLICLSGGDPLWRSNKELADLLWELGMQNYRVSVETSGTLSMQEYAKYKWVSWVLDYKVKSAGVKQSFQLVNLAWLTKYDYIKFVLHDEEDYKEFLTAYDYIKNQSECVAKIAVGLFWGTPKFTNEELITRLINDKLLAKVRVNMQAHKLLTLADNTPQEMYKRIAIPKKYENYRRII